MSASVLVAVAVNSLTDSVASQLPATGMLWLGLSGGLDSVALLYLLNELPQCKNRLRAIHVNHGLSANADDWQAHCQRLCEHYGIPLICVAVAVQDEGDGIEQAARTLRYDAFRQHLQSGDTLLLAHHADDQVETFFQRVFRGAGLSGLGGIPARRSLGDGVQLLRPLLDIERERLLTTAQNAGLTWVEDESNTDSRYERNWWRHELLPQVFARFPGRKAPLLRSVKQLQQDQQVLQELLAPHTDACLVEVEWPHTAAYALNIEALQALPEPWWPYVIRDWLARLQVAAADQQWLKTLLCDVVNAADDAQPRLSLNNDCLYRHRGQLYLVHQGIASEPFTIKLNAEFTGCDWAGGSLCVADGNSTGIRAGEYQLVAAHTVRGQRLKMAGRPSKSVKALFQEADIPVWLRTEWPALIRDGRLCALPRLGCDEAFSDTSGFAIDWR